jgi:hypothetical protein
MQYVLTVKQLGSWAQPKLLGLEAAFRRRTWRPLSSRGNFDHLLAGAGPDIYYAAVDFVDRPRSPCIMPRYMQDIESHLLQGVNLVNAADIL